MTTYTQSGFFDHTTDAGFHSWGADLFNSLTYSSASITQTSDTGQLTSGALAAAARPGTSTALGYWIFAFNDSLQSTVPIYIKIELGTGGTTSTPSVWITVGAATNGAGTLSSIMQARTQITGLPAATTTNYTTYSSSQTSGFFGLLFKKNGFTATGLTIGLIIARTVDSTGASTGTGYTILISAANSQPTINMVAIVTGVATLLATAVTTYTQFTGSITSTSVAGVSQMIKWYAATPQIFPLIHCGTVLTSENTDLSTPTATLVGSSSHTYKIFALGGSQTFGLAGTGLAMIWE